MSETKVRLSASREAAPEQCSRRPDEIDEVEQMDQISIDMGVVSAPTMLI